MREIKKVLYCADLFLSEPPIPYLKWTPEAVMKILKKIFGNVETIYREHHPILGEYWYVKIQEGDNCGKSKI